MNLYFLIEGEKTEKALYNYWLNILLPNFSKVHNLSDVSKFNFLMYCGGGIPSIYNHAVNAIKDINEKPIFQKLIICLDGEELGTQRRINDLTTHIQQSGFSLPKSCQLEIVVQNVCIETWFLGISSLIKQAPSTQPLISYMRHFDVKNNDPELLPNLINSTTFNTKAQFHERYFRAILEEHNDPKLFYSKRRPDVVLNETFLEELQDRTSKTNHLENLKKFFELIDSINSEMKYYS